MNAVVVVAAAVAGGGGGAWTGVAFQPMSCSSRKMLSLMVVVVGPFKR